MAIILVVDDDQAVLRFVREAVASAGEHQVVEAVGADQALSEARKHQLDAAVVDLRLGSSCGLTLIGQLRSIRPQLACLLMTGFPDTTVTMSVVGAAKTFDVLYKPFSSIQLVNVLEQSLKGTGAACGTRATASRVPPLDGLIGHSDRMRHVRDCIQRYATAREPVLILGESGTGKDIVARALHRQSGQKGPFVPVNCGAAGPDSLLEAELFGHERGAFTGATERRAGWFEAAGRGTLYLDEIGELSLAGQVKLLRAIECGEVVPLGSRRAVPVTARFVAATNRNLSVMVGQGFRLDLYHRLAVLEIRMPALREHSEDLPVLTDHLLKRCCSELGLPVPRVADSFRARLTSHRWPGNVRELMQALKRAVLVDTDSNLTADDLSLVGSELELEERRRDPAITTLADALVRCERQMIQETLDRTPDLGTAAKELGIDPKTLYLKRRQYGLAPGSHYDSD